MVTLTTYSPEETQRLARLLAELITPPMAIGLQGTLGAGKTCFTKGLLSSLGVDEDEVSSPTFSIVHQYQATVPVIHIDLYRLESSDLLNLCLDEQIDEYLYDLNGFAVVEWANKHPQVLPNEQTSKTSIRIQVVDEFTRTFDISGSDSMIQNLQEEWHKCH